MWVSFGFGSGLASGSDRVCREVYNRKLLRKDFLEATRLVKEFRLVGLYDVILDNPFETHSEKMETVRALMEIPKPFLAEFFSLTLSILGPNSRRESNKGVPG